MFTPEQIAAREKVWRASQDGTELHLSVDESKALWLSILKTGTELQQRRKEIASLLGFERA